MFLQAYWPSHLLDYALPQPRLISDSGTQPIVSLTTVRPATVVQSSDTPASRHNLQMLGLSRKPCRHILSLAILVHQWKL
nr:hypothetical protein Iba_chr01dCG11200 [Ipomoea batatas]